VVAALIRRFYEAKLSGSPRVTVWGMGDPLSDLFGRTGFNGRLGHPTNTRATVVHNSDLLSRLAGRAELCIVSPPEPGRQRPRKSGACIRWVGAAGLPQFRC
jgi:hypothetical protein